MFLEESLRHLEALLEDRDDESVEWAAKVCKACRAVMHYITLSPIEPDKMREAKGLFTRTLNGMKRGGEIGERYLNIQGRLRNLDRLLEGKPLEQFPVRAQEP